MYFDGEQPDLRERGGRLPVALAFPGPARSALSALGWQAVYRLCAQSPWLAMERFFLSPGEAVPRSEDSSDPLDAFPLAAFSLGYELDGIRLVEALRSAAIPLTANQRSGYPILLGGGPLAFLNPAPLSPALDAWFVGEAEAGLVPCLEQAAAMILAGAEKSTVLKAMTGYSGIYVPGMSALPVKRAIAPGGRILADFACSGFVSHEAEFKDTMLLEVNRGCPYGCRFCAAGYVYRPPRQARLQDLVAAVSQVRPRKVGLVGTALTDWPQLQEFLTWLGTEKIKFTLSSVRADGVSESLLAILRNAGLRTLTLALEGPSGRIRRMANKHLEEDVFLRAVELAAARGVNHLKVYLIMGWPGETDEDYKELERFLAEVCRAGRVGGGKKGIGHLTLGVNPLVPKPWTPLQWAPMAGEKYLEETFERLRSLAKPLRGVRVEGDKPFWARLQGLLARGDETVFDLVRLAGEHGWRQALKEWDGDPAWFLDRERGKDEAFPWECIDIGVSRESLWREWQRYQTCKQTPKCPETGCGRCGACEPTG